jgi:hypothetical protein
VGSRNSKEASVVGEKRRKDRIIGAVARETL